MNKRYFFYLACVVALVCFNELSAAKKHRNAQLDELNARGKQLEALYQQQLDNLSNNLLNITNLDESKKSAYANARKAESKAKRQVSSLTESLKKNRDRGLLRHRQNWLAKTNAAIEKTTEKLKQAEALPGNDAAKQKAIKEAKDYMVHLADNKEAALRELKKCEDAAAKNKKEEPRLAKRLEAAKKALVKAEEQTSKTLVGLGLDDFIKSEKWDGQLAKHALLLTATPTSLALFAQESPERELLVNQLLGDLDLIKQVMIAGGANANRFGKAMEIYTAIQKSSSKAKEGVLQRLALAIALEHAVVLGQRNPTAQADGPKIVDPVKRYKHYEKAYLNKELDSAFKDLSVWDYRMVVDGNEPDEALEWGREMLRNYRPDHISMKDYRWKYVAAVKTDIRYGSQDNKFDKPELHFFQNILMNGGVCGRRAFFGRFILRAFGIPTIARPQRGHAALAHWTPEGWVVCLGGGWGTGWTKGQGRRAGGDLVFLKESQARMTGDLYIQVKRAEWMAGVLKEDRGFWIGVANDVQTRVITESKAQILAAVGTDIGEANESKVKEKIKTATIVAKDKKISVNRKGVITIPAAATSRPLNNTRKIKFMDSVLGGKQLHYSRNGKGAETFEYTVDAKRAGKYKLTARVVTPSWKQSLYVAVNGAKETVDIELPFTVGMWDQTKPIEVALKEGKNVLTFSRNQEGLKGVSIKDFTLTPM